MITLIIMWIMKAIGATSEQIYRVLPAVSDLDIIEKIKELDIYSYFDTLSRTNKAIIYFVLTFELASEFWAFMLFLTRWVPKKWQQRKNRVQHDAENLKSIKWKIENNFELTGKELKFYKKYSKANTKS